FALHTGMKTQPIETPSTQRYFSAEQIGDTLLLAFKGVMTAPNTYFAAMPVASDYRDSLMLLCIYLAIPALLLGILSGIVGTIIILPFSLLFGFIGTWLWAAYLSWAARRFCAADLSTVAAFQICAYSSAPLIFSWIPIIGILAWMSNLYLNWQGLVSHARISAGAALLIILGAFFVMAISLAILVALLIYATTRFGVHLPSAPAIWF
ncbi:MAG: YIP1 family protein, partial [Mariprofundaceae bacterium]|nr:YIP1 family protein [Mariprofundaceae bacterium]